MIPPPSRAPQIQAQVMPIDLFSQIQANKASFDAIPEVDGQPALTVHPKIKAVKDMVYEICLYDVIKVKKYQALDDRQKSLLNKLMSYKFQPDILDMIDTGGVKVIKTDEYLLNSASQSPEKIILYMRLRLLYESKFLKHKYLDPQNENLIPANILAYHYLGEAHPESEVTKSTSYSGLFQEINSLRETAARKLESDSGMIWLNGMRNLLHDLTHLPNEAVLESYRRDLEKKLDHLFHDEDGDLCAFFPKIKQKLKEKKAYLPLTMEELKKWEKIVIKSLKIELMSLSNFLAKASQENTQGQFSLNYSEASRKIEAGSMSNRTNGVIENTIDHSSRSGVPTLDFKIRENQRKSGF